MGFTNCPRCGDRSYEKLKSHAHCFGCFYSPEFAASAVEVIPNWATQSLNESGTTAVGKLREGRDPTYADLSGPENDAA